MAEPRLSALILAAGLSSRMDGFKPLLRIGPKTILEHALELFCLSAIEETVTVVGHRAEELLPTLADRQARYVRNTAYHSGMFSSIQAGVQTLDAGCEAFFLLPVDIPLVERRTIIKLAEAHVHNPARLVIHPQFQGRRGHPPLISAQLIKPILAHGEGGGLRSLLRNYQARALDVPVDDPFILRDVDTPADLQRLRELYRQRTGSR